MKGEVELFSRVRPHVERWAKHPSIISAELARKDTPTRRELLWVYRSLIWLVALAIVFVACTADLASQWTWHGVAAALLIPDAGALVIALLMVVHHTVLGQSNPFAKDRAKVGLNWKGRKQEALLHRNLRRMPWHGQRVGRLKEGDGRYAMMSVWMSASKEGVQFRVLEHHTPKLYQRVTRGSVWSVNVWQYAGRPAQDWLKITDINEEAEKILDKRSEMEALAMKTEETAYGNAIATDRLKAMVLNFRR